MKLFELQRDVDESGVSGTGVVAQGVIFDNGWCALTWLTKHTSVAFYTDINEVIAIHGHGGKTHVVQIANCDDVIVSVLVTNCAQDGFEGVAHDFYDKPNHRYVWRERSRFAALFHHVDLSKGADDD